MDPNKNLINAINPDEVDADALSDTSFFEENEEKNACE